MTDKKNKSFSLTNKVDLFASFLSCRFYTYTICKMIYQNIIVLSKSLNYF